MRSANERQCALLHGKLTRMICHFIFHCTFTVRFRRGAIACWIIAGALAVLAVILYSKKTVSACRAIVYVCRSSARKQLTRYCSVVCFLQFRCSSIIHSFSISSRHLLHLSVLLLLQLDKVPKSCKQAADGFVFVAIASCILRNAACESRMQS